MIWERWDELSDRFAKALESSDPEARIAASGDPELVELFGWHRRAGDFLEDQRPQRDNPWVGRLIQGRYRLESVLGRGGSGVVFQASDEQVAGRRVVIKLLHDFWSSDDWMRRHFREEAGLLARLDHPGIVSLIDAGEVEDGRLFLVLPFHEGRTLRDALSTGPLDAPFAARLLREIGDAVSYSHGQGVLHRDLKPENILLVRRADGEHPLLIDFGIAHIGDAGAPPHTTTHLMGSAVYMAPEHLMGKAAAASDIYSLGVVAWEMLAGARPFDSVTPFALPELQRRGTGDAFYRLRPDLGTGIGKLLARALAFDPARRPAPATAFTAELADALVAGTMDSRLARLWVLRRSRRWMLAGGTTALVAAGAGGWWLRDHLEPLSPQERVIDYPAGFSNEMAGFTTHREITMRAIRNFANTRIESFRFTSPDQGHVRKPLTWRQKQWAFRRGWKFSALFRPETGFATLLFDCGVFAPRFEAGFLVSGQRIQLGATERIRQGPEGPYRDVTLPPSPGLVRVEIAYDAAKRTADVAMDGTVLIRGYAGTLEYRDDHGVDFVVGTLDGTMGSAIFRSLHFEIQ